MTNRRGWLRRVGGGLVALLPVWSRAARGAAVPAGVADSARPWHAELARIIATSDRKDRWEEWPWETIVTGRSPDGEVSLSRYAYLPIEVDAGLLADFAAVCELVGTLNHRPFCGAAPGCLMFAGISTERTFGGGLAARYRFQYRLTPWTQFLGPHGKSRPAADARGRWPFPAADFGRLP